MKSSSIRTLLVGFIPMAAFWIPFVTAAEVQHVQFGSTASLSCHLSYIYPTTWFHQNQGLTPTVVLYASLKNGNPFPEYQLSPRFSAALMNRSIALVITGVEERDLGLYYCIADVHRKLNVGSGTELQVSSSSSVSSPSPAPDSCPGFSWSPSEYWYHMVVGLMLLTMVLTVCIVHWKTEKSDKEPTNETPDAIYTFI